MKRLAGWGASGLPRPIVWLQLLIGWLPIWALYTVLIAVSHRDVPIGWAIVAGLRAIGTAAILGIAVNRLTAYFPWPRPVPFVFLMTHALGAAAFSLLWVGSVSLIESAIRWQLVIVTTPNGVAPFLVLGVWLYLMVAGVSYAYRATGRAALAEAAAARAELAALRAQINPHFLFNTLHTVVQLIPREPIRAGEAAEQLAALLRTTLERDRDVVTVNEEMAFVDQYLALERIRFGDRLRIHRNVQAGAGDSQLPSFAIQTLVENAVRHGAQPNIGPTDITIAGHLDGDILTVTVTDTGSGAGRTAEGQPGTGLRRLAERLQVLYGPRGRLETSATATGFVASLTVPQHPEWPT